MASFLWLFHNSTYISYFPPAYSECGSRILILGGGGEGGGSGGISEPVFVKVYGAQESIPRNRFRQPM